MKRHIEQQPLMAIIIEVLGAKDFKDVVEAVEKELGERYDPDSSSYSISKYTGKDRDCWIVLGKRTTERVIIDLEG